MSRQRASRLSELTAGRQVPPAARLHSPCRACSGAGAALLAASREGFVGQRCPVTYPLEFCTCSSWPLLVISTTSRSWSGPIVTALKVGLLLTGGGEA